MNSGSNNFIAQTGSERARRGPDPTENRAKASRGFLAAKLRR
jgi:hypothetical protein